MYLTAAISEKLPQDAGAYLMKRVRVRAVMAWKKNTVKVVSVISKPTIEYLEVIIDAKLDFRKHLEYACQKVNSATIAL